MCEYPPDGNRPGIVHKNNVAIFYGSRSRKRRIISQKIEKAPSESSDESDLLFAAVPCTTRSCNSDAAPPLSVVGLNDSDGAEEMVGEEVGA